MLNPAYRFLICFFNFFLAGIILVNYVGWSGAYVNVINGATTYWNGSYFGWSSVYGFLAYLDELFNASDFLSIKMFSVHLQEFTNTALFNIPQALAESQGASVNSLSGLFVFLDVLFQPIIVIYRLLILVLHVVWYIWVLVNGVFQLFWGAFNMPMENMPNSSEYMPSMLSYVA